jgi:hypothetical protein
MPRLTRSEVGVLLGLAALVGTVLGSILGIHYYNTHSGDWRIGVAAVAIAVGVAIGSVAAAVITWFAIDITMTVVKDLFDVIPALGAIAAGIYLLQYQSGGDSVTGTSWFEIIGHGMGIYFIAKGLFIGRTTYLQVDARNKLAELVALVGAAPEAQPPPPAVRARVDDLPNAPATEA